MTFDVHAELFNGKNYRQALEFGYCIVALSLIQLLGHVNDGSLTARLVALRQDSSNTMQGCVALENKKFLIVRMN